MCNIEGVDPSAHSASEHKLTAFVEEHILNKSVPIIELEIIMLVGLPILTNNLQMCIT